MNGEASSPPPVGAQSAACEFVRSLSVELSGGRVELPSFPDVWADDEHRVPGCQSRVWMEMVERDGKCYFAGASDAAIVSGLVAMLLRVYSGRDAAEIAATDPVFLKDLGLIEALSTNRGNGIAAMARRIRGAIRPLSPPV